MRRLFFLFLPFASACLASAVSLAGCSSSDGGTRAEPSGSSNDTGSSDTNVDGSAGDTDGGSEAGPSANRCDPKKPFGPFEHLTEITDLLPGEPWLSRDERTIYFSHETPPPQIQLELMVATRSAIGSPFGPASVVTVPNATGNEATASLSADGLSLTFARGETGDPFHRVTRSSPTSPFANDTTLVVGAPKPYKGVRAPRVVASGALYYLVIEDASYAIYRDAPGGGGGTIALADSGDVGCLAVSSDEKTLYVAGSGASNHFIIGRASRADVSTPFPPVTHVAELDDLSPSSQGFELSWVSDDDCVVYGSILTIDGKSSIVRATRGR